MNPSSKPTSLDGEMRLLFYQLPTDYLQTVSLLDRWSVVYT